MPRRLPGGGGHEPETLPPRLAFAIVLLVLTGFALIAVLNVVDSGPSPLLLAACISSSVALFALQTVHSAPGAQRFRERWGRHTLAVQALLTFGPLVSFGLTWGGMGGFLAGSCLLILAAPGCWVAFGAVTVVAGLSGALGGVGWVDSTYLVISTVLTGFIVYGLTRLSNLVAEVHHARRELAELAVAEERLRFARDLHDLLGFGLSAITLKSELTFRLVTTRPERAREELAGILQISRQSLADVRAVASGYREMSLAAEVASAEEVLSAAEIEVATELRCGQLSGAVSTVLATVVREGVTNVLRHSKAQRCRIEAVELAGADGPVVRLTLSNDGVREPGWSGSRIAGGGTGGSGLGNLRRRAEETGGRLDSGADEEGWYRLVVEVPRETGGRRGTPAEP